MNVCVYCSASENLDPKYYTMATTFGETLANHHHTLVYGGFTRGIMGAVAQGVYNKNGRIISVVPEIFDEVNYVFKSAEVVHTKTMSTRKKVMEEKSDVFVVLPGGIGTFDEMFETLTLISLGQIHKKIVVYNYDHCYDLLEKMLDENTKNGFTSKKSRNILKFYEDMNTLIEEL